MEIARNTHDTVDSISKKDMQSGTAGKLLLRALLSVQLNHHLQTKKSAKS
jgi:hypothetical protein